jgi:hypothetical protein
MGCVRAGLLDYICIPTPESIEQPIFILQHVLSYLY